MAITLSGFMTCENCDRTFYSQVAYNFHIKNSHPTSIMMSPATLENKNSQNLEETTIKEERHTEKNQILAISNKITANNVAEKREQTTSYYQDQIAQDISLAPIRDEQILRTIAHQKSQKFKCQICSKWYGSKRYLARHIKSTHMDANILECHLCNKDFSCQTILKQHIDEVHASKKNFECQFCKKCFNHNYNLQGHIKMVHENVRPFKCVVCEVRFHLKTGLQVHIDSVHVTDKPFKCDMCKGGWGSKSFLKSHMRMSHNLRKPLECQICKYRFSIEKSLNSHMAQKHNSEVKVQNQFSRRELVKTGLEPTVKCEYCNKMYHSIRRVHGHQARQHKDLGLTPVAPKQCKICHKSFTSANYVDIHVKLVHQDTKSFDCEFCQQTFKLQFTLKIHVNAVHKKIKRFGCRNCSERFSSAPIRNKHIIECQLNSPSKMKIEISSVDDNDNQKLLEQDLSQTLNGKISQIANESAKTLKCPICSKSFGCQANLEMHVYCVHDNFKRFECRNCKERFKSASVRDKHIITCENVSSSTMKNEIDKPDKIEKITMNEPDNRQTLESEKKPEQNMAVVGAINFQCQLCIKRFTLAVNLGRHVKMAHAKV